MTQPQRPIRNLSDLGEIVRQRRKVARLSLDEAAALLGVGRRFLVELEGGKRRASIETVLRVLNGLGLELRIEPRSPQSTAAAADNDNRGASA